MWSIEESKSKGWHQTKLYYWPAVLASFIYALLGANGNFGGSVSQGSKAAGEYQDYISYGTMSMETLSFIMIILGVVFILLVLFQIFVGNPIIVGKNRFYMESRALGHSAGVGRVFWVFGSGHYLNVVKVMFLKGLFTTLWSFALIIPGIIKDYEYFMIPYILSENPEAHWRDAFALTKDMMGGNKFQYFLFQLSFIGWIFLVIVGGVLVVNIVPLLGIFATFGGALLIQPYMEASAAEVYAFLRDTVEGYPFHGFGAVEAESVNEKEENDYYI